MVHGSSGGQHWARRAGYDVEADPPAAKAKAAADLKELHPMARQSWVDAVNQHARTCAIDIRGGRHRIGDDDNQRARFGIPVEIAAAQRRQVDDIARPGVTSRDGDHPRSSSSIQYRRARPSSVSTIASIA